MEKVAILGMGLSGRSCKDFFLRKKIPFICVDRDQKTLKELSLQNISTILETEIMPKNISTLIVGPAISRTHPWVLLAKQRKIPIKTEIDLALEILSKNKKPCFGITGSNGKTTTALFLAHLLNICGVKSLAVGNIGVLFLDHVENSDIAAFSVELSSFQLEKANLYSVMTAGVILNFSANHLDFHKNMKEYLLAKFNLRFYLDKKAPFFIPKEIFLEAVNVYSNSFKIEDYINDSLIKQDLNIFPHDIYNFSIAFLLASSVYDISEHMFYKAIHSFRKPPHRLENIIEIDGIKYVNDSKSTTVAAVRAAVLAIRKNVIIIMGGIDKGGDFSSLLSVFENKVKLVICFGKAAKLLYYIFSIEYLVSKRETLEEALEEACKHAKKGDTVLFSPGCSSFDQFKNFEHRGEMFKKLVYRLKRERFCET